VEGLAVEDQVAQSQPTLVHNVGAADLVPLGDHGVDALAVHLLVGDREQYDVAT